MRGARDELAVVLDHPAGTVRQVDWGGMTVEVGPIRTELGPSRVLRGLPDDRCQCPHWGYVIKGQLRYAFADREEVFNAGDVYYVEAGHLPLAGADTECTDRLQETMAVVERNYQAFLREQGGA